jgi:small subunit ribosomal protein S13
MAEKDKAAAPAPAAEKAEKGKKGATEKKEAPQQKIKKVSDNPDFKYIVHLLNTDIKGDLKVEYALASIKGIGLRTAAAIVAKAGVPKNKYMGDLDDAQTASVEKAIATMTEYVPHWMVNLQNDLETGDDAHLIGQDLLGKNRDNINIMRMIRTFKGIRHEMGQRVRGQRTRAHGRQGLAVGVIKKAEPQGGAKDAKKEDKK